ncbi:hypothetical protein L7F22_045887 [Adiantum nelumboides]|nr:hypothetical protein [Adiantum nelumboides]
MPLKIDAPLLTDVPREPCQGVGSKKAPKAPKIATPLNIATPLKVTMPPGQDAPLLADIPREQGQGSVLKKTPKAPKVPKEAQPTKHVRFVQGQYDSLSSEEPRQDASLKKAPVPKALRDPTNKLGRTFFVDARGLKIATPLKIAMPEGQDAPLLTDVPQEQGQGSENGNACPSRCSSVSSDVPQEPCQDASSKKAPAPKAPMEAQPRKQVKGSGPLKAQKSSQSKEDMIVLEGSSPLKVQKSGQAKKLSGTTGSKPPNTQVNKRKAKADVKEKEGTTVPKQQNVKRLKRMKEVEVREAIERKLAVDEVKVKGHTDKGHLEKVLEVKIALKRDAVKNKAKKHVEKGQEDEGPADKALALVGSSKRPKLQTPYVKVINEGKLVRICRAEPPCASRNTLMEKRTRMIQHLKKVHGLDVFIRQRLGGRPQGSVNNDMPKSMGTLIVLSDEDKSSRGSSGGSDDHRDENDESNQDGSGDDDLDYGSDGDGDDDDSGSDKNDGGDDISGGSDDEDDGSGGGGSGSGGDGSGSGGEMT